jgi:hypothetical protein
LAPDAPKIDVCIRLWGYSGDFSGLGTPVGPLMAAAGVSQGLAYGQLSGDVVQMPANSWMALQFGPPGSCSSSYILNIFSSTDDIGVNAELTIPMFEYQFGSSAEYTTAPAVTGALAANPSAAVQLVVNATYDTTSTGYALYDTPSGGSASDLIFDLTEYNYDTTSLSPGTYSLQLDLATTTTVLQTYTSVSLAAGSRSLWLPYHDTATTSRLAQCDLGQTGAGTVTTCAY